MALSQEQKKFLNEITYRPKDCLDRIKNDHTYLESFHNQFLIDGTSLLHVVISCLSIDNENYNFYKEMANYILKNSSISLFDKKDNNKDNAYDIFYSKYIKVLNGSFSEKIKKYSSTLDNIDEKIKNTEDNVFELLLELIISSGKKITEYKYSEFIQFLIINKRYSELEKILKINISPLISLSKIMENIIKNDDILSLELLLKYKPTITEKINKISITTTFSSDMSNLLSISLREQSYKVSEYFLKNFNFPLTGKIDISSYQTDPYIFYLSSSQKTFNYPILEVLDKNISLFNTIIKDMNQKDFLIVLQTYKNKKYLSSPYPERNIFSFINSKDTYFSSFLDKIKTLNFSDDKVEFINNLLNSCTTTNLHRVLEILNTMNVENRNDNIKNEEKINLQIFNNKIYKSELSNDKQDILLSIYKKIDNMVSISPESFIKEEMLNYPNIILKTIKLIDIENFRGNFLTHVLMDNEDFLVKHSNENISSSLKTIYENNNSKNFNDSEMKLFNPNFSLISYLLSKDIPHVIDIFSDNDLLKENKNIFEYIKISNKEKYRSIAKRLIDLNFSPFIENNNNHFLKLIINQMDKNTIKDILLKNNKNLNDFIDNSYLWKNFCYKSDTDKDLEEKFKLLKDLDINLAEPKLFYSILSINNHQLSSFYLNKIENDNIELNSFIFELNKNKFYNSSLALLEKRPYCALLQNKQKNLSCKYLIKELFKTKSDNIKNLLIKNIEVLEELKSPESILKIQKDINEIPSLTYLYPELEVILNHSLISSKLKEKDKHKINKI